MIAWTVRTAATDDIPGIVDLINAVLPAEERTTPEEFRHEEGMRRPESAFLRLVVAGERELIAVGQAENSHLRPRHKFKLGIAVRPTPRRQGVGTELERRLRAFSVESGAGELTAIIREDDAGSRAFIEGRGYREAYRRFEMELDVTAFDWGRFAGWRARLGDLRLFSIAEAGSYEENVSKLFDLSMTLSRDVPHPEGAPDFTIEDFRKFATMPGFRPNGLFILADGERWVGISVVHCLDGRPAYTDFTGVHRAYRGRGLATLLKLATIEFVQRQGITAMRTNNDTVNYPMVAVNEKLGYRRLPARIAMKLTLAP